MSCSSLSALRRCAVIAAPSMRRSVPQFMQMQRNSITSFSTICEQQSYKSIQSQHQRSCNLMTSLQPNQSRQFAPVALTKSMHQEQIANSQQASNQHRLQAQESPSSLATLSTSTISHINSNICNSMSSIMSAKFDCNNDEEASSFTQLCHTRRTYKANVLQRKRKHGFLHRLSTKSGRRLLNRRREKGRKTLST
jgi:large subunit ribosomal protein L34